MEVPVRGLAAILFSCLLGSEAEHHGSIFLGMIFFFIVLFLSFFVGSMYGAYVVNYKQYLILENLHSFM